MKTTHKISKYAVMLGTAAGLTISLAGCYNYDPYPPPHAVSHTVVYSDGGVYSYYEYPNDYRYYNNYYDDDWQARRDRQLRQEKDGLGHSDDRNFHNRDDYDHWDR